MCLPASASAKRVSIPHSALRNDDDDVSIDSHYHGFSAEPPAAATHCPMADMQINKARYVSDRRYILRSGTCDGGSFQSMNYRMSLAEQYTARGPARVQCSKPTIHVVAVVVRLHICVYVCV